MATKIDSFEKLFLILLSDIFYVENEIIDKLPALAKKVQSKELKEALTVHVKETKSQVDRLNKIFSILGQKPVRVDWFGSMHNLYNKANEFFAENPAGPVFDATVIAFAQHIEHYEIATYGTLIEYADVLGYDEIKDLLKDTLKEESHADSLLSKLAMGGFFSQGINVKAAK